MKDELISFETAKLAYQKGVKLNESARVGFSPNGLELSECFWNYHCNEKNSIPRSTQSLLQRWLREEYEFIILINYSYWDDNFMFEICGRRVNSDILLGIDFSNRFETYEEALESGLINALNLI